MKAAQVLLAQLRGKSPEAESKALGLHRFKVSFGLESGLWMPIGYHPALAKQRAVWALIVAFEGRRGFVLEDLAQMADSKDQADRWCAQEAMIAELRHPEGFGRTPPGVWRT